MPEIIGKLNKVDSINAFLNPVGQQISGRLNDNITNAKWGNIDGNITDQTDLIEYIDEYGCKIEHITVNGVEQPIVDKTVNINVQNVDMRVSQNVLEVTIQ